MAFWIGFRSVSLSSCLPLSLSAFLSLAVSVFIWLFVYSVLCLVCWPISGDTARQATKWRPNLLHALVQSQAHFLLPSCPPPLSISLRLIAIACQKILRTKLKIFCCCKKSLQTETETLKVRVLYTVTYLLYNFFQCSCVKLESFWSVTLQCHKTLLTFQLQTVLCDTFWSAVEWGGRAGGERRGEVSQKVSWNILYGVFVSVFDMRLNNFMSVLSRRLF